MQAAPRPPPGPTPRAQRSRASWLRQKGSDPFWRSRSVQRRRQPAAVLGRQRMILAKLGEHAHHHLPDPLANVAAGILKRAQEQLEPTLCLALLERLEPRRE